MIVIDGGVGQLEAARKVNDPDRVLEIHKSLVPLLEAEMRDSLESELSRWFLRLIHNRLRTGRDDRVSLKPKCGRWFTHCDALV